MNRLPLLAFALVVIAARPSRAQTSSRATPDSAARAVVVAGIVRALHEELARAVTDTGTTPWVLFAGDSAGRWARERAGLGRLLRARAPRADDRRVAALPTPEVTIVQDSVRTRFSIVHYERCSAGWTARGTDYAWAAPRSPTWRVEGPVVARLWDGFTCAEVARDPSVAVSPPFPDGGRGSVPPAS